MKDFDSISSTIKILEAIWFNKIEYLLEIISSIFFLSSLHIQFPVSTSMIQSILSKNIHAHEIRVQQLQIVMKRRKPVTWIRIWKVTLRLG